MTRAESGDLELRPQRSSSLVRPHAAMSKARTPGDQVRRRRPPRERAAGKQQPPPPGHSTAQVDALDDRPPDPRDPVKVTQTPKPATSRLAAGGQRVKTAFVLGGGGVLGAHEGGR